MDKERQARTNSPSASISAKVSTARSLHKHSTHSLHLDRSHLTYRLFVTIIRPTLNLIQGSQTNDAIGIFSSHITRRQDTRQISSKQESNYESPPTSHFSISQYQKGLSSLSTAHLIASLALSTPHSTAHPSLLLDRSPLLLLFLTLSS